MSAVDGKLILVDGTSVPINTGNVKDALAARNLLWLDIKPADPDAIALLRDVFQMHPLAIEAVTEFGQRPRVEDFDLGSAGPSRRAARRHYSPTSADLAASHPGQPDRQLLPAIVGIRRSLR
jgi:hypothetical protein